MVMSAIDTSSLYGRIRSALVTNLKNGLTIDAQMTISAYRIAQPAMPVIWVRPSATDGIQYHQSMGLSGLAVGEYAFVCEAYYPNGDEAAQISLDRLLDPSGGNSVKAALESDPTLGGIAAQLVVRRASGYLEYRTNDGNIALGCAWDVDIHMQGT